MFKFIKLDACYKIHLLRGVCSEERLRGLHLGIETLIIERLLTEVNTETGSYCTTNWIFFRFFSFRSGHFLTWFIFSRMFITGLWKDNIGANTTPFLCYKFDHIVRPSSFSAMCKINPYIKYNLNYLMFRDMSRFTSARQYYGVPLSAKLNVYAIFYRSIKWLFTENL